MLWILIVILAVLAALVLSHFAYLRARARNDATPGRWNVATDASHKSSQEDQVRGQRQ
jgi:hypothetical protein